MKEPIGMYILGCLIIVLLSIIFGWKMYNAAENGKMDYTEPDEDE